MNKMRVAAVLIIFAILGGVLCVTGYDMAIPYISWIAIVFINNDADSTIMNLISNVVLLILSILVIATISATTVTNQIVVTIFLMLAIIHFGACVNLYFMIKR